jgi:GT2 family glycosyltransferase
LEPGRASVSAVIVSHNEGDMLRRTVLNLRGTLPADGEIVVLDDASTDGSADASGWGVPGVRVFRPADRLGAARARNFGAQQARGEMIVFCDAHIEAPPGWVDRFAAALERRDVGAVGATISAMGSPSLKGCGFTWRDPYLNVRWLEPCGVSHPYPVPMLGGAFLAMRRDVFEATGGFDSGLVVWGAEDAELCLRLWLLGCECWIDPAVDVAHLFRSAHPYAVNWEAMLHNILRVTMLHFGDARTERVVEALRTNAAFPAAFARLAQGDTWQRRAALRAQRRYDDDWFFERFGQAF